MLADAVCDERIQFAFASRQLTGRSKGAWRQRLCRCAIRPGERMHRLASCPAGIEYGRTRLQEWPALAFRRPLRGVCWVRWHLGLPPPSESVSAGAMAIVGAGRSVQQSLTAPCWTHVVNRIAPKVFGCSQSDRSRRPITAAARRRASQGRMNVPTCKICPTPARRGARARPLGISAPYPRAPR